ncbi:MULTISPECIES: hypothetical protein [unclassified Streptomyces]
MSDTGWGCEDTGWGYRGDIGWGAADPGWGFAARRRDTGWV